jgi:hypothetical protein
MTADRLRQAAQKIRGAADGLPSDGTSRTTTTNGARLASTTSRCGPRLWRWP